jgi:hypothetical protein
MIKFFDKFKRKFALPNRVDFIFLDLMIRKKNVSLLQSVALALYVWLAILDKYATLVVKTSMSEMLSSLT